MVRPPSPTVPLLLMVAAQCAAGLDNGVGVRPTLGWNSWNAFNRRLDEKVVRATANLLVSTGLAAKGYTYLNLDDTWAASERAANGSLVQDLGKFPTPMAALIEDVHGKGLHFGIYTDVGYKTCAGRPGTYGHEVQDANTFAAWGVDFVKSDSCYTAANAKSAPADGPRCYADYQRFAAALNATGRAMVHSIKGPCGRKTNGSQGSCSPADSSAVAHMRRAAGDVHDNWASIITVLQDAVTVVNASRPGFFADLDILEIGNGGLTQVEERSVFSLWCAVKSPILLGNDLSKMSNATLETVGNVELLAVNQDVLGLAARPVSGDEPVQVWAGKLGQAGPRGATWRVPVTDSPDLVDERIVVVFNTGNATVTQAVQWQDTVECPPSLDACNWDVRDLWSGEVSRAVVGGVNITVPSHASVALRLENATAVYPSRS